MDNIYYILKDSSNSLWRNKGAALLKSFFTFLYFLVLATLFRTWFTVAHLKKVEQQHLAEEVDSLDVLIQSNANENFLTLLNSLNIALIIFCMGLFLFGVMYLYIYFQRTIVLDKKEFRIKKMLGASSLQVTSELFSEPLLLLIPSSIFGLIITECFYRSFFKIADSWITDILSPPSYFIIFVDFPLIGFFLLFLIYLFICLKQKITKL